VLQQQYSIHAGKTQCFNNRLKAYQENRGIQQTDTSTFIS